MLDTTLLAPEKVRTIRRAEYDQMVALGLFDDDRLELLYGVLVSMSPQGSRHADVTAVLDRLLTRRLGRKAHVRKHSPIAVGDHSAPEPDLAVVEARSYRDHHPTTAFLVIEVADSSRKIDRILKPGLYAECRVPEYWIVDLNAEEIVVHRQPANGRYRQTTAVSRGGRLQLVAFPKIEIEADEVFGELRGRLRRGGKGRGSKRPKRR